MEVDIQSNDNSRLHNNRIMKNKEKAYLHTFHLCLAQVVFANFD